MLTDQVFCISFYIICINQSTSICMFKFRAKHLADVDAYLYTTSRILAPSIRISNLSMFNFEKETVEKYSVSDYSGRRGEEAGSSRSSSLSIPLYLVVAYPGPLGTDEMNTVYLIHIICYSTLFPRYFPLPPFFPPS